jgi:hypothetical protein
MPFDHADSAIMNMISSIVIVLGLPLGFYLAFLTLNPIDHLKYASTEIGEGFMHGLQRGINETALNQLAKQLTHTVIIGATIVPDVQMVQARFRHI